VENLHIEATQYTPSIDFDANKGELAIAGKSYPENSFEFYAPVIEWLKNYFESTALKTTQINLDLEYLNSSSLKAYFELFDILEELDTQEHAVAVKWIYDEDNDICEETGEDFIADFESLDIELVVK
jgi:hypothetical protein